MTVLHTILAGSAIADPLFIVHDAGALLRILKKEVIFNSEEN